MQMKKILGLTVLATIFLTGQAVAHVSPPTFEKVQNETVTATADVPTVEVDHRLSPEDFEMLELVLDRVAREVYAEHAERIAEIMDTSDISMMIADLEANSVSREMVAKLTYTKRGRAEVRLRCYCNNSYDPVNAKSDIQCGRRSFKG